MRDERRRLTTVRAIGLTGIVLCAVAVIHAAAADDAVSQTSALRPALPFHAPFDGSVHAVYADGDPALYWVATLTPRQDAKRGLPETGEIRVAKGEGRFGDALRFTARRSPRVFFQGAKNVAYAASNWAGSASFWLSVDPQAELEAGFCDPVQITPKAW